MSSLNMLEQIGDDINLDGEGDNSSFEGVVRSEVQSRVVDLMSKPVCIDNDPRPCEPVASPEVLDRYKKMIGEGRGLSREQVMRRNAELESSDRELYDYIKVRGKYAVEMIDWRERQNEIRSAANDAFLEVIDGSLGAGLAKMEGRVVDAIVEGIEGNFKKASGE